MSTRASFLAGATALVVVTGGGGVRGFAVAADAPAPSRTTALGDWLRMLPDGTVEMYTDKVEVGMGVPTGFAQFVADELDVPFERVHPVLGDTNDTVSAGASAEATPRFAATSPFGMPRRRCAASCSPQHRSSSGLASHSSTSKTA